MEGLTGKVMKKMMLQVEREMDEWLGQAVGLLREKYQIG